MKFQSGIHLFNYTRKIYTNENVGLSRMQEQDLKEISEYIFNAYQYLSQLNLGGYTKTLNYFPWDLVRLATSIVKDGNPLDRIFGANKVLVYQISLLLKGAESGEIDFDDSLWRSYYTDITPRVLRDREYSDEFLQDFEDKSEWFGIYFIYDDNSELIYIGKSKNLFNRISYQLVEKKGSYYAYATSETKADMHIYELYYINKFKPTLNIDCVEDDPVTFELIDLEFSELKPAFKEVIVYE